MFFRKIFSGSLTELRYIRRTRAYLEEARMAMLLPVDILVNHLPIHTLNDAETHKICHGQPVHVAEKDAIIQGCRLYDSQQRFVGIGRMRADSLLWPDRLLAFSPAA
jgi:tRNA pseudouridine55 synthase